jgi:hypothetical protein
MTMANDTVGELIEALPDGGSRLMAALEAQEQRIRDEMIAEGQVEIDERGNFRPRDLAGLQRLANLFSRTELVPSHYRNNKFNCAIAIQMALRCKVDILTFMQASYVVKGKAAIEAKLAVAMLASSGKIKGRIRYEWKRNKEGKAMACTAIAIDAETGEQLDQTVTWEMVLAEKWNTNSKWESLRDLMFQYRSAMFLCRVYFPDVLMGMISKDEADDMESGERTVVTTQPVRGSRDKAQLLTFDDEPAKPIPFDHRAAKERFADATTIEEVDSLRAEEEARATTDDERTLVDVLATEAKERVRGNQ